MRPKTIGIIGGAGPLSGAFLLQRLLQLSTSIYGCYRDADFPKIILLNIPFSDMLSEKIDTSKLRQELCDALKQLRINGAAILAIACNTLHVFLDENENLTDLIHLPKAIKTEILDLPLGLCTSTSIKFALHKSFFPCVYPPSSVQTKIDAMIDQILKGAELQSIAQELLKIIETQPEKTVILGCTELSLIRHLLMPSDKFIIDPLEIMAKKILEKSFLNI